MRQLFQNHKLISGGAGIQYQIDAREGSCDSSVPMPLRILSWGLGLKCRAWPVLAPATQPVVCNDCSSETLCRCPRHSILVVSRLLRQNYYQLRGFSNIYVSQLWMLGSSRWRHLAQCLVSYVKTPCRFSIWWEPTSWFRDSHLLPVSSPGGGALWVSVIRGTISIGEGSTLMAQPAQRPRL